MVEINHKIIITGMICLTSIYVALMITGKDTEALGYTIIGLIGLSIGVVVPTPRIDKKKGALIW